MSNITNGAVVSNPPPTPDGTAVIINAAHSGQRVAFERHDVDSMPCIIGNAKKHMTDADKFFLAVFSAAGGRTTIHPLPVRDLCLYEVHEGDFVSILEHDNATLYIDSYYITGITDKLIQAVHAII